MIYVWDVLGPYVMTMDELLRFLEILLDKNLVRIDPTP